jgi:hypothetical protein
MAAVGWRMERYSLSGLVPDGGAQPTMSARVVPTKCRKLKRATTGLRPPGWRSAETCVVLGWRGGIEKPLCATLLFELGSSDHELLVVIMDSVLQNGVMVSNA